MPAYKLGYYRKGAKTQTGQQLWEIWDDAEEYATGKPYVALVEGTRSDAEEAIEQAQEC